MASKPRTQAEIVAASKERREWKDTELARQMTRLSLTSRDVGDAAGVSNATVWRAARGRDPDLSTARKLSRFFGMTIEALFPETE